MSKYRRRFTKEEFQKELFTHLKDMPPGYLRAHDKLEEITKWKSEHYARALEALDKAKSRIEKMAGQDTQQEAEQAVREIDDAINAYGEASMSGNSHWDVYNSDEK